MPIRSFIPCSLSHLKCSRERFETEKLPEGRVFRAEGDRSGDGDVERERERENRGWWIVGQEARGTFTYVANKRGEKRFRNGLPFLYSFLREERFNDREES